MNVKVTVFRSGRMTPAGDYAETNPLSVTADQAKPVGRVGRSEGLFCSPDLTQMATWHHANLGLTRCGYVADAREIRYFGPEPYGYPVRAWEWLSWRSGAPSADDVHAYWQMGRPLREILADPDAFLDGVPGDDRERRVELLIDPRHITSHRPVSDRRLILAADRHTASSLESVLRPGAWRRGRTLRDYAAEAAAA